jgi:signal transduction histidine kinase
MSKRSKPSNHLYGTIAWSFAALAGLWPALPGIGNIGLGPPVSFVELVALSNGWLGGVAVVGLAGALVATLHLLTAFDLWVDERALRKGGIQGNWRTTRFGFAASLAVATLVGSCWTAYHQLRIDAHGNYTAVIEDYSSRSGEAWNRFYAAFDQARPSDQLHIPAPGDDPFPALREMARSPVVEGPYHLSPTGMLTLHLDREVRQVFLPTWQGPVHVPFWPVFGPQAAHLGHGEYLDAIVAAIARLHHGYYYPTANLNRGFSPIWSRSQDAIRYEKGNYRVGYLGYSLSRSFCDHQGRDILMAVGLPGAWEIGAIRDNPYLLPPPRDNRMWHLGSVRLAMDSYQDKLGGLSHLENTVFLLAALVFLFLASMVEAVRQLRAMIAERAMQMAQSSFVSGVSHEMRTPLATVRLYAELLEQGLDKEPGQRGEFTGAILFEVDRLHRLIENVLDFARISGRKRTYSFVPTDLRGVIDEAVQATKGPLIAANVTCEVHMPADLVASIDRDAIVQALANLLSNAAKYGTAGGRVWIGAMPGPLGVALTVQDFGQGVPRHEQVKIFHPFYRIAGQAVGGTGLGLALVMEYARAHGGYVALDSPPGQGATFSLHLPEDPSLASAIAPMGGPSGWRGAIAALVLRKSAS